MAEATVNYTERALQPPRSAFARPATNSATARTNHSTQLTLGGSWKTLGDRLTLRSSYDQSLAGNNANADFPTRLDLGADYQLTRAVTLFADQEFTWGDKEDTQGTRVGLKTHTPGRAARSAPRWSRISMKTAPGSSPISA